MSDELENEAREAAAVGPPILGPVPTDPAPQAPEPPAAPAHSDQIWATCEHCGNLIGPISKLLHVGLRECWSCASVACDRCWARANARCPTCDVAATAGPIIAADRRGRARRTPIAIAAMALVILAGSAFTFTIGGGSSAPSASQDPGSTSVALGASALPTGGDPSNSESPGLSGSTPSPDASVPGSTIEPSSPIPGPTPTPTPTRGAVDPTPTPGPTPRPTATPTPHPTPKPTATPGPTPCVRVAPQLIGARKNSAAGLWAAAGFTGGVTAMPGTGNYVIGTQSRVAGQAYPCDSAVTIGP